MSIRSDVILTAEEYNRLVGRIKEVIKSYSSFLMKDDILKLYLIMREFSEFFSVLGVPRFDEKKIPQFGAAATRDSFDEINLINPDLDELFSKAQTLNRVIVDVDNTVSAQRNDCSLLLAEVFDRISNFQLDLGTDDTVIFSDDFTDESKMEFGNAVRIDPEAGALLLATSRMDNLNDHVKMTQWKVVSTPDNAEPVDISFGKQFGVVGEKKNSEHGIRHYKNPPTDLVWDSVPVVMKSLNSVGGPNTSSDEVTFLEFEVVEFGESLLQDQFVRDNIDVVTQHDETTFSYSQRTKKFGNIGSDLPVLEVSLNITFLSPVTANSLICNLRTVDKDIRANISKVVYTTSSGESKTLLPKAVGQQVFHFGVGDEVVGVEIFLDQRRSYKIRHDVRIFVRDQGEGKAGFKVSDIDLTDVGRSLASSAFGEGSANV